MAETMIKAGNRLSLGKSRTLTQPKAGKTDIERLSVQLQR
ncbi:MAG: hypothetical protein MAG451_00466 [Anaerolineales bacterium]|nr:hypothetical protein [Anaerolineales bacterium]